jgi:ribonuclease HII
MISVGIDEVGRGCWAGPLVAGAVLLSVPIAGLTDSKLLSKKRRQELAEIIYQEAAATGLGWVDAATIDKVGITTAVKMAMQEALQQIEIAYDQVIIDGHFNFLDQNPKAIAIIKADFTHPEVSAASIIAKVARDKYMSQLAPGYEVF